MFGQKFLVYVFGAGCARNSFESSFYVCLCMYIGCIVGYVVVALQNNDDWEKGERGLSLNHRNIIDISVFFSLLCISLYIVYIFP